MTPDTNSATSAPETPATADESTAKDARDGFFGFVVGLYAAALLTPAALLAVAVRVTAAPGVLFFVLLGTAIVVTGAVGRVAGRESLAVRLGATRWVWAAMGVPLAYVAFPLVADLAGSDAIPDPVVPIGILGAAFGFVGGIGLVVASHNRHAKAMLADAEELADFRAAAPERDRRLVKRATVALVVAGVFGFVGSILLDFEPLRWLFQLAIPAGAGLYGATSERRVTISDAGLVVGNPAHKQFRPWSEYESYDVTEETIVVRRAGWSPWGVWDLRRDPEDVDDPEALAAALGRVLPRRE